MSKVITALANLATKLDNAKLTKAADVLDSVNANVLKIVTAQYEGIQGYWVRNQRCWSNCYRQKREATNKPAQEVWFECQKEYEASLGKDSSPWDKYANELPNLIKTASVRVQHRAFAEQERFHAKLWSKVAEGTEYPVAVFESIDERAQEISDSILNQAIKVASVSADLKKKGEVELAKEAAKIATFLVKMSQAHMGVSESNAWMNPKNWGQGIKEMVGGWTGGTSPQVLQKRLQRVLTTIENLRSRFPADMTKLTPQQDQSLRPQFQQLQQPIQGELQQLAKMTRNNPAAGRIYQQILPAFNQFGHAQNIPSRRKALDQLSQALQQAAGSVGQLQPTQQGAQQNPAVDNQQRENPQYAQMRSELMQAKQAGDWEKVVEIGNQMSQQLKGKIPAADMSAIQKNIQYATKQLNKNPADINNGNQPDTSGTSQTSTTGTPQQPNTSGNPQGSRPLTELHQEFTQATKDGNWQQAEKLIQEYDARTDLPSIVKDQLAKWKPYIDKKVHSLPEVPGEVQQDTQQTESVPSTPTTSTTPTNPVDPSQNTTEQLPPTAPVAPTSDEQVTPTAPVPPVAAPTGTQREPEQIENEFEKAWKVKDYAKAAALLDEADRDPKNTAEDKAHIAERKQELQQKMANIGQFLQANADVVNNYSANNALTEVASPQQVASSTPAPKDASRKVFNLRKFSQARRFLNLHPIDTAHGFNSPQEAAEWAHKHYISQGKEAELAKHGFTYKRNSQPSAAAPVAPVPPRVTAPTTVDQNAGTTPTTNTSVNKGKGSNKTTPSTTTDPATPVLQPKVGDTVRIRIKGKYQEKPETSEADGKLISPSPDGRGFIFQYTGTPATGRNLTVGKRNIIDIRKPGQPEVAATGRFLRPKERQPKTVDTAQSTPVSDPVSQIATPTNTTPTAGPKEQITDIKEVGKEEPSASGDTASPSGLDPLDTLFEEVGVPYQAAPQTDPVAQQKSTAVSPVASNTEQVSSPVQENKAYNPDEKKLEKIIGKPLDKATPEEIGDGIAKFFEQGNPIWEGKTEYLDQKKYPRSAKQTSPTVSPTVSTPTKDTGGQPVTNTATTIDPLDSLRANDHINNVLGTSGIIDNPKQKASIQKFLAVMKDGKGSLTPQEIQDVKNYSNDTNMRIGPRQKDLKKYLKRCVNQYAGLLEGNASPSAQTAAPISPPKVDTGLVSPAIEPKQEVQEQTTSPATSTQPLPPSYENPQANEPAATNELADNSFVPGPKASIDKSSLRAADKFYDSLFDETRSNYLLDQDYEAPKYGRSVEKLLESIISSGKEKISPEDLQKVNEFIQSKADNNKFKQSRTQFREALKSMVEQYYQLIVGQPELAQATASAKQRITYASLDSDAKKMLLKLKKGFER